MQKGVLVSAIQCKVCGDVLVSTHRHDFKGCRCAAEARVCIDGGLDYIRVLGNPAQIRWVGTHSEDFVAVQESLAALEGLSSVVNEETVARAMQALPGLRAVYERWTLGGYLKDDGPGL